MRKFWIGWLSELVVYGEVKELFLLTGGVRLGIYGKRKEKAEENGKIILYWFFKKIKISFYSRLSCGKFELRISNCCLGIRCTNPCKFWAENHELNPSPSRAILSWFICYIVLSYNIHANFSLVLRYCV